MKRNGKRALALLLTLVMALGLCAPVLAAEDIFGPETPAGLGEETPAAPMEPEAPDWPKAASAEPVDAPAAEPAAADNVYEVGTADELKEALTDPEKGKTRIIRLTDNIELKEPIDIGEQGQFLLELNGKTITKTNDIPAGIAAIAVQGMSSVSLQGDGTITGPGTLLQVNGGALHLEGVIVDSGGDGSCAAVCANDGTVSVNDGTVIEAEGTAIYADVDACVEILGGSVISRGGCAVVARSEYQHPGKVKVMGGTVRSDTGAGVCLLSGGRLSMSRDAAVTGAAGVVALGDTGTASISGGTVTANGTASVPVEGVFVPPAAVVADNNGEATLYDGVFRAAAGQPAVVYTKNGMPAYEQNRVGGSIRLQVLGGSFSSAVDINLLHSDLNTELVSGGMYSYYTSQAKAERDRKDGDTVNIRRPDRADLVAVGFLPKADDAMLTKLAEKVGAGAVTGSGDNTFYAAFRAAADGQTYTVKVKKRYGFSEKEVFKKEFEAGTEGGLVCFAPGDEGVANMDEIQGMYVVRLAVVGADAAICGFTIEIYQVTYVPGDGAQGEAVTVYTDAAGLEAALAAGRPAGITLSGGSNTWDEPAAEQTGDYAWTVTFPAHYEYHGGLIIPDTTPSPSPSASPEPSESPSPEPGTTPEPGVTPAPSPVPVPVDPPKTNGGSGWSYDYDTGDYYYFVDGEPKANYWANEAAASQWGYWYYVGADGRLATGLQYIENNNGTGWYFLQPDNADGCVGRMLTGWQWLGPDIGMGWFNTAHGGVNGQCTWTENWGDYDSATGLWEDGLSHK